MTRAVVMGDIAWPHLYHVGDEAMTESAVVQLLARGVEHITLVGADPAVAEHLHGVPAVSRFHFKLKWPRAWHDSHLRKVLRPLAEYTRMPGPAKTVLDAVHDSDFVVIAGGGNMTSDYVHQLYERLALVRVARHFGRPVYISSQTIGTVWREEDVEVIREILDGARAFGAREQTSYEEATVLCGSPGRVVYTGDDALLLQPSAIAPRTSDVLPEKYLVASFERPGWLAEEDIDRYYAQVAIALDACAAALDCSVLLIPHAGSFDSATPKDDVVSHARIAALGTRIVGLPLARTSEVLSIMRGAVCSISTRYHPLVFAAASGLSMIGLANSAYTWNRMRGAARQFGAEEYVLPVEAMHHPDTFAKIVSETTALATLRNSVRENTASRSANIAAWWDAVVADASEATNGSACDRFRELADPVQVPPVPSMVALVHQIGREAVHRGEAEDRLRWASDAWSARQARSDDLVDELRRRIEALEHERSALSHDLHERDGQLSRGAVELHRVNDALQSAEAEKVQWRSAAKSFRAEVQRFRNRRTTKILDALGRLRGGR